MKGFLKRDFYLIKSNLKFYAVFMAIFAGVALLDHINTTMFSLYVVIFGASSIMGLFNYDDFNHWTAYGAAAGGRRTMVDARYLLAALMGVGIAAVQIAMGLLGREDNAFPMTAVYSGAYFLYAAVILPICYHFGGTKARTVMIVVVAGIAAVAGMGGAILSISGGGSLRLPPITLLFPLLGIAAFVLSRQVSLAIMAKKEL